MRHIEVEREATANIHREHAEANKRMVETDLTLQGKWNKIVELEGQLADLESKKNKSERINKALVNKTATLAAEAVREEQVANQRVNAVKEQAAKEIMKAKADAESRKRRLESSSTSKHSNMAGKMAATVEKLRVYITKCTADYLKIKSKKELRRGMINMIRSLEAVGDNIDGVDKLEKWIRTTYANSEDQAAAAAQLFIHGAMVGTRENMEAVIAAMNQEDRAIDEENGIEPDIPAATTTNTTEAAQTEMIVNALAGVSASLSAATTKVAPRAAAVAATTDDDIE
jgi:hypothetical protein